MPPTGNESSNESSEVEESIINRNNVNYQMEKKKKKVKILSFILFRQTNLLKDLAGGYKNWIEFKSQTPRRKKATNAYKKWSS